MLSRNSIKIKAEPEILNEIHSALSPASVSTDIYNYSKYTTDASRFLSLLFDGIATNYEEFGIDWAYVESCDITDEGLSIEAYALNGDLHRWKSEIYRKYEGRSIEIYLVIARSVRFKSY